MSTNHQNQREKNSGKYGVQNLDFLGDKFKISYPTSTGNFQTKLGGYLTILLSVFSTSMFFLVMSQFFNKDAPVVMTSTEFGSPITSFSLYEENLYLPLGFVTVGVSLRGFQVSSFVTVIAIVDSVVFNTDPSSEGLEVSPFRAFEYIPCDDIKDQRMRDWVKKVVTLPGFGKMMVCPDFRGNPEDFVVADDYEKYVWKWASIKIFPCSLPDRSKCASPNQIRALQINYGHPLRLLQPSNGHNPMITSFFRRSINIDPRTAKVVKEKVMRHKVLDDTMSLIPPTLKMEYASLTEDSIDFKHRHEAQMYCTKEQISKGPMGGCQEYLSFDYAATGEVMVTRRSYKKITTMLGEFGGILKIMTTTIFFFYGVYSMRKVKSVLGKIIFSEDYKTESRLRELIDGNAKFVAGSGNKVVPKTAKNKEGGEEPTMKEVMAELVKSRSSVDNLMKKLNLLDVIEKVFFDEESKALLPLLLLKTKKAEMIEKKREEKQEENNQQVGQVNFFRQAKQGTDSQKQPFKAAYDKLRNSGSADRVRQAVKDYIVSELQDTFEEVDNQPGIFLPIPPSQTKLKIEKMPVSIISEDLSTAQLVKKVKPKDEQSSMFSSARAMSLQGGGPGTPLYQFSKRKNFESGSQRRVVKPLRKKVKMRESRFSNKFEKADINPKN